jgi:uncharacterized protein YbjQ (UPF0145 family)
LVAYKQEMAKAREIVFSEMENKAELLGADGIVGIDIDYQARHFCESLLWAS